jgi:lipopolysaccharide exporter
MSELARQSVSAAKWGLISSVAKFGMQLLVNIAIARLLGPDAYGLFALATIGLLVATFMSEIGLGWSLMQRPEVDDTVIRFVFTWQCLSGLVGLLLMTLGAHIMAEWQRDVRLTEVMQWLGLCCLFNGMAATATNLLRRELQFKALAKIQLLSYVLAYGLVGLPLAALEQGVWALVAAWVVQSALCAILSFRAKPHALRPQLLIARPREYIDVGSTVLLTNLCNWALTNMDRLLLGRLAGAQSTGFYAVGYNLAAVPNGLLISALQPAFLASGARMQDDLPRMAKGYLEVQSFIWTVLSPLFALLALTGPQIIAVLYGDRWSESGQVFSTLVLAMPAYLAWSLSTPVLWNTGRKWLELGLQLPLLLLAAPALVWAGEQGVGCVAAVASVVFVLRYGLMLLPAALVLGLPAMAFGQMALRSLAMVTLVVGPASLVRFAFNPALQSPWALGALQLLAGLLPWGLIVLFWPHLLGAPTLGLLRRFVPKASAFGKVWAARAAAGMKEV